MLDEVIEQRHVNLAPHPVDFFLRPQGFDKQHIRTSLGICCTASQGIVETSHGQGVRTCNKYQILVCAGVAGGAELDHHVSEWHHFLAVEVPTALGKGLVFDV